MRKGWIGARVLLLLLCLAGARPAFASYGTQGSLAVSTEGGAVIAREIPLGTQVEIADSDLSAGGVGNTAAAVYASNIPTAALSASASAENALNSSGPPPDYWFASASASTALHDDLHFTVPAGTYPSGLYAVARVRVDGSVTGSGGGSAFLGYDLLFGEGLSDSLVSPAAPLSLEVDLTAELVAPGVTLPAPMTTPVPFFASVQVDANAPGETAQSGASEVTVRLAYVSVPPAVTWTSDSGVFCSVACGAAVPGLGDRAVVALVLVLVGAALAILGAKALRVG